MEVSKQQSEKIGQFILDNVSSHPADIVKITARRFAISRQAAARHIKRLIFNGDIITEGNTSGRIYRQSQERKVKFVYALADLPEVHDIWEKDILPQVRCLPENIIDLWSFCFRAIFNNGLRHSQGTAIQVQVIQRKTQTTIDIADNGMGLFQNIMRNTPRTISRVLNEDAVPTHGDNAIFKTCIPVKLERYTAASLSSRSQARRVLARVVRSNFAVLDFFGVEKIGLAFADQVFRVFSHEHPEIQLLSCNANRQIEAVIQAAKDNSEGIIEPNSY